MKTNTAKRRIALVQEHWTRLTADVVTGKLDVSPTAAHLPALHADSTPTPVDSLEEIEAEEVDV